MRLQPREALPGAAVHAQAERQVVQRPATDVKAVRVRKVALVAVDRALADERPGPGGNDDTCAQPHVTRGHA